MRSPGLACSRFVNVVKSKPVAMRNNYNIKFMLALAIGSA